VKVTAVDDPCDPAAVRGAGRELVQGQLAIQERMSGSSWNFDGDPVG